MVFPYAKLGMLELYYDFIDFYVECRALPILRYGQRFRIFESLDDSVSKDKLK